MTPSSRDGSAQQAFEEGLALEAGGNLKRALQSFKLAAERDPQAVPILEAVGRTYEAMGKALQATEWYLRAAQAQDDAANPRAPKARWIYDLAAERAWLEDLRPNQIDQREVSAAADHLERLIARFGADAIAYRKLALLLGRLERIAEVGTLFDQARKATLRGQRWR